MLPVKAPRDPAPSRVKYRLERLWLRPTIRNFVKLGLPLIAAAGLTAMLAADPQVRGKVAATWDGLRDRIAAHPSLQVTELSFTDMSEGMARRIDAALDIPLPVSSMDLDLAALHDRILALDAVAAARVRVVAGGVLEITVEERVPSVVWRADDGLFLLDAEGAMVDRVAARGLRPDLPLIGGEGADAVVAEALELIAVAAPIESELRGLVRVGERRWDVVLADGLEIRLPEDDPAAALARVMALNAAEQILERDIVLVDMRDARRPILRLSERALYEMRRARGLIEEEDA